MNQLFVFILTMLIMMVGLDFLARAGGPRAHSAYRRVIGRIGGYFRRQAGRLMHWAWREYHQGIVGFGLGILTVLWFLGYFH